jgi:hypothetical protein
MLLRDVDGTFAGVRIGPVPSPPVVFAFVDGAFRATRISPSRAASGSLVAYLSSSASTYS